ncbi:hypothetical protein D9M70_637070 [compost metagenome]
MLLEHLAENLGHRDVVENASTETLGKASQPGPQTHMAKPDCRAMVTLDEFMQQTMHRAALRPEM